jgi:hypothetical protein
MIDRAITQGIGIMGGIQPNMGEMDRVPSGSIICLATDGVKAVNLARFLEDEAGMPDLAATAKFA